MTSPGATRVPILVATTRAPSDDPGILYTPANAARRSISTRSSYRSRRTENREIGEVQWPKKLPPDPAKDFATLSVTWIPDVEAAEAWFLKTARRTGAC
jgi:esterase/lipase superfamily enzyme